MKQEHYSFEDTALNVKLTFAFSITEKTFDEKKSFLELLKKAVLMLETEINK